MNYSRVLPSALMLMLFAPPWASARIPEHPAQVHISLLLQNATTVFRGSVSAIIPIQTTGENTIARFIVDRWYRGVGPAFVDIRFSYNSYWAVHGHNCINFQPGSHWIVFATNDKVGPLRLVHDCEGALAVSSRLASQIPDTTDALSHTLADFAAGLQDTTVAARITSIQRLGNLRSPEILPFLHPIL